MNTATTTLRNGHQRAWVEFLGGLKNPSDLSYYIVTNVVFIVVVFLNRDAMIPELGLPAMLFVFPGVLALQLVLTATYGVATLVATEREDGTLLRAKSLPHGMAGYVTGQVGRTLYEYVFSAAILLIAASILISGVWNNGLGGALQLVAVIVLGLLATLPLGFAVGSIFKNPRTVGGLGLLVVGGVVAVSGVFVPLSTLPLFLQILGQILPMYWIGLGLRHALLPDSAVAVEIGESWRVFETLGVLGAWAVLGLVLAPVLLRRMARRESGSSVEARRQTALQRI